MHQVLGRRRLSTHCLSDRVWLLHDRLECHTRNAELRQRRLGVKAEHRVRGGDRRCKILGRTFDALLPPQHRRQRRRRTAWCLSDMLSCIVGPRMRHCARERLSAGRRHVVEL